MQSLSLKPFVVSLFLTAAPAYAKVDPAAYKAQVEDGLKQLAKSSVESFFTQAGLEQPEQVDVTVDANIDFAQKEPVVEGADVAVTLTTEHLPPVIREARASVARALAAQGYRFSADVDDQRPLAALKVGVIAPAHLDAEGRAFKEYVTLGALFLGFIAALALTFYLLVRPFRRKKAKRLPPRPVAPLEPEHQPVVELPPLPESELQLDFKELAKASVAVVRKTFDQLPFDKAFAMLAAADPETRSTVIDKLQLQPAVRERLERELSQPPT